MSVEVKGVHQMLRQIDEAYGETKCSELKIKL